ncbi:hypothetical protein P886_1895 [Alteromonadaceae bacterium 2753L.S.0a.02]|nr:hypothetical protein P886_1895 [Alteromonadaceae bacterium 2753L.S.0a.02]
MAYKILCPDTEVAPDITLTDNGSCFEMIWETGHLIDPAEYDLTRLEFVCETLAAGRLPDYAVSDLGCPVVSEKFKNLLEGLGIKNIQYFPASLAENTGAAPKPGFYAANIIGLVDIINLDESEADVMERRGKISVFSIDELVLNEVPPSAGEIFRARYFSRLLLAGDKLVDCVASQGIAGVRFVTAEKWDGINGEK